MQVYMVTIVATAAGSFAVTARLPDVVRRWADPRLDGRPCLLQGPGKTPGITGEAKGTPDEITERECLCVPFHGVPHQSIVVRGLTPTEPLSHLHRGRVAPHLRARGNLPLPDRPVEQYGHRNMQVDLDSCALMCARYTWPIPT